MASILDAAVLVGKESTYGTPATLTRAYEAKADSWKIEIEHLESVGFRAGMETLRSDRRKPVAMGGEGTIEVDVLDKGMGLLLEASLGGATGPTQVATTNAYEQVFTSTSTAPTGSYTVQVQRPDADGAIRSFTHHGAMITSWKLAQSVGEFLNLELSFDFEEVDTVTSPGVATYPSDARTFDWTQCAITISGAPVDTTSFELNADLSLKTDRRFLRSNSNKKQPKRGGVPSYEGTLEAEFSDLDHYNSFVAGTIVEIVATWTGREIESGQHYEVTVTLPACQFNGESPEVSLDDMPKQPLPFKVLDNGTDPAVTLKIKSTDTAF